MSGAAGSRPGGNRHRLGTDLRRLREGRSLLLSDAAERLGVAQSTLSRIENGKAQARTLYVTTLLDLYGVDDPDERKRLADLAREGQRKSWWADCADLLAPDTGQYLDLEATAAHVLSYSAHLVPGLLQTPDYAKAAFLAARPGLTPGQARSLVAVQVQRQELVRRNARIALHLIADESALLRPVGGTQVLAAQLRKLAGLAADLGATLRVIELASAGQPVSPSFTVLRLADPDDSWVACAEGIGGQVTFAGRRADVGAARDAFGALSRAAMSPAGSLSLIEKAAARH